MGGFLGVGGSSANTDRGNQLSATQGDWSIFNYGLPVAQQQQKAGSTALSGAQDYFGKLLKAGRQETAQSAAPAINAQLAGADASRKEQAVTGTGRTGGTAEVNAEAGAKTQSNIDNIINQTLQSQKKEGAEGLVQTGGLQLSNAIANLGLSSDAVNDILSNSTQSRVNSFEIAQKEGAGVGSLILAGLGLF